jgi:molybdopterin-synthase adenylyltransferase
MVMIDPVPGGDQQPGGRWKLRARTQLVPIGDVLIMRLGSRRLRIPSYGTAEELTLEQLSKGCSRGDFLAAADGWAAQERERGVRLFELLLEAGYLETDAEPTEIPRDDLARFDRLVSFFSEFELSGTSRYHYLGRLLDAKVGVVGAGGMGSWILYGLACFGVGNIAIMDGDRVEASNLNRSILFTEGDIGRPKVEAAAQALTRFWPRCVVAADERRVNSPDDLASLASWADVVIGAADQPTWLIREWLAEACRSAGVPLIHPSGLRVGPFYVPGKSACSMCEWAERVEFDPRYPDVVARARRMPRGTSGGLAPWASITASVAVMEVFKYLTGVGPPTTLNAVWTLAESYTGSVRKLPPHRDCRVCGGEGADNATKSEQGQDVD